MPDNAERILRGEACIAHWKEQAGESILGELGDEDAVDLITDALHFAVSRGWDIAAIIRMARTNLEAELKGED